MRITNNALQQIEQIESPVVGGPTMAIQANGEEEEPHSVWERVATVATVLIGFQFALLALIGL